MKKTLFLITASVLLSSCWTEDLEKELMPNVLEPSIVNQVIRIDTLTLFSGFTYKKFSFTINRPGIPQWDRVQHIYITRSMGASTRINKDSSTFFDLAFYPTGPNWVVLRLMDYYGELSAPSDTFRFIVN